MLRLPPLRPCRLLPDRRYLAVLLIALFIMLSVACGGTSKDGDMRDASRTSEPVAATSTAFPEGDLPVGQRVTEPTFGTTIRRVSDESEHGRFETQIYSQLQAFSADNALILLDGSDGFVVRRLDDLGIIEGLDTSGWNAPRWHPTRPHAVFHFDSNDDTHVLLQQTDIDDLSTITVFTFPDRYPYVRVAPSWEELSRDGTWLAAELTGDDGGTVIVSLNVSSGKIGAEIAVDELFASTCDPDPEWGILEPDWVGVSPLGRYLVVQWARDGTERCSGLETFDVTTGAFVGRVYDGHQHGDLGVDMDGESEFYMTTEFSSPEDPNRPALAVRALPGTVTASSPRYLRSVEWSDEDHISCQGPDGVCLVSWGSLDATSDPLQDSIFLIGTDAAVRALAKHKSSSCGYWAQPRASISRDGKLAIFASDWGDMTGSPSCSAEFELGLSDPYIIEIGS
jgi:hypothetical protein